MWDIFTDETVEGRYVLWLSSKIADGIYDIYHYQNLIMMLYQTSFIPVVEDDHNRWTDGVALRDDFYEETGEMEYMDETGCSFLEMLIAMSSRYERDVLTDDTNNWTMILFWTMMENLGLTAYNDSVFDQNIVQAIIVTCMYRGYEKDGTGSIFRRSPDSNANYKRTPFWMQMGWYINDYLI